MKKFMYVVNHIPDNKFTANGTIEISIREVTEHPSATRTGWISMEWYIATDDPTLGFYGFKMTVESDCYLQCYGEQLSLARRVLTKIEEVFFSRNPEEVVRVLESMKIVQGVYDKREGGYVPLSEVKPLDQSEFIDDYITFGEKYCTVGVIASDEREARVLISLSAHKSGYNSFLDKWVAAGSPVKKLDHQTPNTTPALDIIKAIRDEMKEVRDES